MRFVKPLILVQLPFALKTRKSNPPFAPRLTGKKFQGQGITTVLRVPGLGITLLFSAKG
jgi:hypothetical protein